MLGRLGDMMMKICACTCSTAKGCMLLAQHRDFAGCSVDCEPLIAAEADLVSTFASQVLSPKADISGSAEVIAAERIFTNERAAVPAGKKASVWAVPPGLDATQVLPNHVLYFMSVMFDDYFLYEMCCPLPLNIWSLVWWSHQYSTDRELFWRTDATGSGYLFKGLQYATRRPGVDSSRAGSLRKRYGGVILRPTGVRGPEKEVASDETVRGGVQGGHVGVVLQVGAGAEQCCH